MHFAESATPVGVSLSHLACLVSKPKNAGSQGMSQPGGTSLHHGWCRASHLGPLSPQIHPSPLCLPQTFVRAAPALFCAPLTSICDIFLILRKSTESSGPQQGPVLSNAPAFPHSPAPQAPTPASQHCSELHFDISKAGSWCLSVFPIPLPLPGFTAPRTQ